MPMPKIELNDRQVAIYLETNRRVDLKRLSEFLGAVGEFADDFFEGDAQLELSQLQTGSVIAVMTAWGGLVAGGGTMGLFALALADRIENYRQRKVERRAAEHVLDDGVVRFEFGAQGINTISVPAANVAAIETILQQRNNLAMPAIDGQKQREQIGYQTSDPDEQTAIDLAEEDEAIREYEKADFDYLVTEAGDRLVTEDGDPLIISGTKSKSTKPEVDEAMGWIEIAGEFITASDGRFALFRSGARQYRVDGPKSVLGNLPIGTKVIVEANFSSEGNLLLNRWRPAEFGNWHT